MSEPEGLIIVGVLGQWASGKTEAARTLIRYLGGEGKVVFLTDRELFTSQAVKHLLEVEGDEIMRSIEEDGRLRLKSKTVTVWLPPGEDLASVALDSLRWDTGEEALMPGWHDRARHELGRQILQRCAEGKPIVVEAAFGPDTEMVAGLPFRLTISNLFTRLEQAGVGPGLVKWIIVEAGYETRAERNRGRPARVPVDRFEKWGADGGDLAPEQQRSLEEQGGDALPAAQRAR